MKAVNNPHLVSIIIPCYNSAKFIEYSIKSALNQTHKDIECLIVDDGSTDQTAEKISSFLKNSNVRYFKKANGGTCSARNLGIAQAKGQFMLFLDSDDLLTKNAVKTLINTIGDHDIAFGSWANFNDKGVAEPIKYDLSSISSSETYLHFKPTVSTALIKSSEAGKWDNSIHVWEVTDYFINLLAMGAKAVFTNEVVTRIRQHSDENRASLQHKHFDPLTTLPFLLRWKETFRKYGTLTDQIEYLLDVSIIDNVFTALRHGKPSREVKFYFNHINKKSLANLQVNKIFSLYSFLRHFKRFQTVMLFKTMSKLLNRSK